MKYIIYARKSTENEDEQEFAVKEKLEIVASFQEAKTAKEPEKYRLEPHLIKIFYGKRKMRNL